jgi:hypothetical protein
VWQDLGDATDLVTQDLFVTLGAALSESLTTFSSTRNYDRCTENSGDGAVPRGTSESACLGDREGVWGLSETRGAKPLHSSSINANPHPIP